MAALGAGVSVAALVDWLGSAGAVESTGELVFVLGGLLAEEGGALAEVVVVAVTVVVFVAVTVCTPVEARAAELVAPADSVAATEPGLDGGTRLGATVGGRAVAVAALDDGDTVATGVGDRSGLGDRLTGGAVTVGASDLVGVGNPEPPPVEQPATTAPMISRALTDPARMIFHRVPIVLLGRELGLDGMRRGPVPSVVRCRRT